LAINLCGKTFETVIKNAKAKESIPIYYAAKQTGKQNEFNYVNMAVLYFSFENDKFDYLNFTVKLTLGIKSDNRHIQYSVSKIDIEQ
jgi:hypothetical protein